MERILSQSSPFPGVFFTMVGPAGAGKNAVMNGVIAGAFGQAERLHQFPTATTRPKRDYEQEGREHQFITHAAFKKLITDDALLEYQEIHGNLMGIPRQSLHDALAAGERLIADIDMYGAQKARAAFPRNTVLVFVAPPSLPILAERMRARGESEAQIAKRLLRAPSEMAFAPECDYVIVNETLEQATAEMIEIVTWELRRHAALMRAAQLGSVGYAVRVTIGHEDAVALNGDHTPLVQPFDLAVPPYQAALQAANRAGVLPPPTTLTTYDAAAPDVPPTRVDYATDEAGGKFIYDYRVQLATRAPLADGWRWEREVN
jgi:guanylate kinase